MKEEPFLIANRIQTPDGTILWSRYTHDYVQYTDDNGDIYVCDGGTAYQGTSVNEIPAKNLSVWSNAPFEEIRRVMLRGTFDKNGERIWIPLYKMNNLHLIGVLDYNEERNIRSPFDKFIEMEIEYRKENNIKIEDKAYCQEDGVQNIIRMPFNSKELEAISIFEKEHSMCYNKPDAKSKTSEFIIRQGYGSGIGVSTHIKCACCGKEEDITDYGCW